VAVPRHLSEVAEAFRVAVAACPVWCCGSPTALQGSGACHAAPPEREAVPCSCRMPQPRAAPNIGVQATVDSRRSSVAPATHRA
jgi:hypothetical protein